MRIKIAINALSAVSLVSSVFAGEGSVPKGVSELDHVFVIMMENHGFSQILGNPNAPFINQEAKLANYATNYFAVGHPSFTNYLEIIGGSNFGIRSDDFPNWHSTCLPNLLTGVTTLDTPAANPPLVCPIYGTGTDAATPALDCTNEVSPPSPCLFNIDGNTSIAAAPNTVGKTIADQLAERGRSWKSYQESLPPTGADGVNYSDGFFTNNTDFTSLISAGSFSSWSVQNVSIPSIGSQSDAQSDIVNLYAAKHNPFVYFRDVQEGTNPNNSLHNIVGFESLFQDLGSGSVPNFSLIAPNQCNDQHGRSNAGAFCNFDGNDNGTQTGLNQALIFQGDVTVNRIVTAIKKSPAWNQGNNAIVVVWDENDYTATPNRVLLIVDTNHGSHGVVSGKSYNHFSLLRTLEGGFGLPCLNHACDSGVNVMTDLFGNGNQGDQGQDQQ
jgi:phosphatidylinositol-3-phosphatase